MDIDQHQNINQIYIKIDKNINMNITIDFIIQQMNQNTDQILNINQNININRNIVWKESLLTLNSSRNIDKSKHKHN